MRVRAYGYANGDTSGASGPAYFKVWTKSGQIYEYGASPAADGNTRALISPTGKTVVSAWAVARISDTVGNYIDFKYQQRDVAWGSGPTAGSPTAGREWNIAEIQYTGNASQAPTNKVIFSYSDRPNNNDKSEAYHQGSKTVSIWRLDTVTTYINSANSTALGAAAGAVKVKTLKLSYANGAITGRSRVASIQECAGAAAATCLPATTFTYGNGGNDAYTAVPNTTFNLSATSMMNTTGSVGVIPVDFNGDGKTDILIWNDTPASNQLWLSNGDGSFRQATNFNITNQNLFKSDGCYTSVIADFNGDGVPDIFRYGAPSNPNGTLCTNPGAHLLYMSETSAKPPSLTVFIKQAAQMSAARG